MIRSLIKHYTRQSVSEVKGPITVVSGKHRRLTFVECPQVRAPDKFFLFLRFLPSHIAAMMSKWSISKASILEWAVKQMLSIIWTSSLMLRC